VLFPVSVSVPVPLLASEPVPLITPPNVDVVAALVLNVPPPVSVTPRFEVKVAVDCSVPPPKVRPLDVSPRLLSELTASVPPLIVVVPV
jgi:hypothetical protein